MLLQNRTGIAAHANILQFTCTTNNDVLLKQILHLERKKTFLNQVKTLLRLEMYILLAKRMLFRQAMQETCLKKLILE